MPSDEGARERKEKKKSSLYHLLSQLGSSKRRADYFAWLKKEPSGQENALKALSPDFTTIDELAEFLGISAYEIRALELEEFPRPPTEAVPPSLRATGEKALLHSLRVLPQKDRASMLRQLLEEAKARGLSEPAARGELQEKLGLSTLEEFNAFWEEAGASNQEDTPGASSALQEKSQLEPTPLEARTGLEAAVSELEELSSPPPRSGTKQKREPKERKKTGESPPWWPNTFRYAYVDANGKQQTGPLSPLRYLEIFNEGKFVWQQEGTEKPVDYPFPEEAERFLASPGKREPSQTTAPRDGVPLQQEAPKSSEEEIPPASREPSPTGDEPVGLALTQETAEAWWLKNRMAWEVLAIAAEEPPLTLTTVTKILAELSIKSRRGSLQPNSLSYYFAQHAGSSVLGSEAVRAFIEEQKNALPPLSSEELDAVRNFVKTMRRKLLAGLPSSRRAAFRGEPFSHPLPVSAEAPPPSAPAPARKPRESWQRAPEKAYEIPKEEWERVAPKSMMGLRQLTVFVYPEHLKRMQVLEKPEEYLELWREGKLTFQNGVKATDEGRPEYYPAVSLKEDAG